jgi:hypothetical protein
MSPFLWAPELSLASATRFSLLTTAALSQKSKSKLCDDRRSVDQSVLVPSPIWGQRPDFYYCQTPSDLLMWGAISDERTSLSFTIVAGPRQRCHSRVQFPRDSLLHVTLSDSRLPQPGDPGPRIYIHQAHGGPVILPALGSHFGVFYDSQGYGGVIRSNPPPHQILTTSPRYITQARTT